jgi:mannose-1-phosphate guanylyltransferase
VEALILVGGQGTRLRPLTLTTPKPMLPVAGVPFLSHQLARLAAVGVDHVVLATSYRAEVFAAHYGDGSALGLRLDYVTEDVALGTGGAMRNAASALDAGPDDPVFVLNGDVLSGHDLSGQLDAHRERGATATLHLVRVDDARAYGCVPTDTDGRVLDFLEKMPAPVCHEINAGCYVLARRVIDAIRPDTVVSAERETFPALLAAGALVLGHLDDAYWLDVGTPAALVRASADLVRGVAPSPLAPVAGEAWKGDGAVVAGTAELTGGSAIGAEARVGPGAVVDGSLLMAGAVVADGAVVRCSVVGAGAVVGAGSMLSDAVVADRARIGPGNELRHGLRVWPGVELPEGAVRFSSDV